MRSLVSHSPALALLLICACWAGDQSNVSNGGDMDVLRAAVDINTIAWWDNDGEQHFTYHAIDRSFPAAGSVYTT